MGESKREKIARMMKEKGELLPQDKQSYNPNAIDMFLPPVNENENSPKTTNNQSSNNEIESENGKIIYISPSLLVTYPDIKLRMKLYTGERRKTFLESIKTTGIIEPVIITPLDDGTYQILAGHNRTDIAKELGIDVKCVIRIGLSEKEKKMIVLDTNLLARSLEDMLFSELAHALYERNELLKERGKRTDLIEKSSDNEDLDNTNKKKNTAGIIGEKYKLSQNNVLRYIRLVYLNEPLLNMVDSKEIAFNTGVELSYLKEEEQSVLVPILKSHKEKISLTYATELKEMSQSAEENIDMVTLMDNFYKAHTTSEFKLKPKILKKVVAKINSIVPSDDLANIEDIIEKALTNYYNQI